MYGWVRLYYHFRLHFNLAIESILSHLSQAEVIQIDVNGLTGPLVKNDLNLCSHIKGSTDVALQSFVYTIKDITGINRN